MKNGTITIHVADGEINKVDYQVDSPPIDTDLHCKKSHGERVTQLEERIIEAAEFISSSITISYSNHHSTVRGAFTCAVVTGKPINLTGEVDGDDETVRS